MAKKIFTSNFNREHKCPDCNYIGTQLLCPNCGHDGAIPIVARRVYQEISWFGYTISLKTVGWEIREKNGKITSIELKTPE